MKPEEKLMVQEMINQAISKAANFQTRKVGDTPTDENQLTPKGYVDNYVSVFGWSSLVSGAAGANTQIQYNSSGDFGADSNFVWITGSKVLRLGGSATVTTPDGTAGGSGSSLDIKTGDGNGAGAGGPVTLNPGDGGATGAGGDVLVIPGTGSVVGDLVVSSVISSVATGGFLVIPKCAGRPTGAATRAGSLIYDTTGNQICVYNGSWRCVALT